MSGPHLRVTFAEVYCEAHSIDRSHFVDHLLGRSLHAPLRWMWWLLRNFRMRYFEPDREFIEFVGRLRRYRDFESEAAEYTYHPYNRGILRRTLQQRVSTQRTRRIFREEFKEAARTSREDDQASSAPAS